MGLNKKYHILTQNAILFAHKKTKLTKFAKMY